jgi:hypothetical protein
VRWEDDWIQTAESLVHDEFKCSYLLVEGDLNIEMVDGRPELNSDNMHMVRIFSVSITRVLNHKP